MSPADFVAEQAPDAVILATGGLRAETVYACDTVIDARDMLPNEGLADELKAAGVEVHKAGDCCDPWNIQYAIRTGNIVGRTI